MPGSRRKSSGGSLVGVLIGVIVLFGIMSPNREALLRGLNAVLGRLLLIGIAVAVAWVAWRLWRRLRTPSAQELARRFEAVRSMSGAQFEVFMADLFRAMGYQAVVLGGAGDQGVDVIISNRGHRVAIQCKNYKRAVGNKPVQEVYAGARHHRCQQAWVVAPAGYTKGATDLAKSTGVSLFDANAIRGWIRQVDKLEKERVNEAHPEIRYSHTAQASVSDEIKEARKRVIWQPHPDDPPKGS